jgi:ribosomal protein L11 methyltransferase
VIRLALRVPRAEAELVLAEVLELVPAGVEEIELPAQDGGEGIVEYAVYGAPGELPALPDLRAAARGAIVEISTSEVADDWSERWKQFHRPVLIEPPEGGASGIPIPALHVRPPWEPPSVHAGACEIVIDPAQAFGTGAHATTRLCLELLLGLAVADDARGAVLDVGAGSGVLAIAAVKLGYGPVVALDNDRESVTAIVDNATTNAAQVEARHFDLRREMLPEIDGVPAPVVLANLLKPLLYGLSSTISSPPVHLIASGLLRAEADGVASELTTRHGLRERSRLERGDWAALWLSRD